MNVLTGMILAMMLFVACPVASAFGAEYGDVRRSATTYHSYASGPLRVCKRNPRYFENAQGQVVYLAGDRRSKS